MEVISTPNSDATNDANSGQRRDTPSVDTTARTVRDKSLHTHSKQYSSVTILCNTERSVTSSQADSHRVDPSGPRPAASCFEMRLPD